MKNLTNNDLQNESFLEGSKEHIAHLRAKISTRRFKDKGEQLKISNKLLFGCITVMCSIMMLLIILDAVIIQASLNWMHYIIIALLAIQLVADSVIYFRNKETIRIKYIAPVLYLITYFFILQSNSMSASIFYILPILIGCMMYVDIKYQRNVTIASILVSITRMLFNWKNFTDSEQTDIVFITILVILISFALYMATKVTWVFNHDSLYTLQDEKKIQSYMMKDILEIASFVRTETEEINEIMRQLNNSTVTVNNSIREITDGINTTSENIQEQTVMTSNIQKSTQAAVNKTTRIVEVMENSITALTEAINLMDQISDFEHTITNTNHLVTSSMSKLQEKTTEVRKIADIIFTISNKTNLLALNASIESARAGEAGRGFAVVADQIRELAEQTRKSTESITKILEELSETAIEVSGNISNSIDATKSQDVFIKKASTDFKQMNQSMRTLSNDIHDMNFTMNELLSSNNTIVDNISQLSATSEEITASSEEAVAIIDTNQQSSQTVNDMLSEVLEKTKEFEKYILPEEQKK